MSYRHFSSSEAPHWPDCEVSKKKTSEKNASPPANRPHPSQGGNKRKRSADRDSMPSLPLVVLLVFASGCAALVFQVAWMRELRLIFGATTAAVSAVLAIFMGGLGVGSAVLGRFVEGSQRPLRLYGLFELGISACVAASPLLLWLADSLYLWAGGVQGLGQVGATATRLLLATVVMGAPAFLMGGTLPAITRAATRAGDAHRAALGLIYGANTLGAVFGTVVTNFFTLEQLGADATLWSGGCLSLLAGAIAFQWGKSLPPLPTPAEPADATPPVQPVESRPAERETAAGVALGPWVIYLAAAVTGFAFFSLEIVWYRMLAPILGGTTFTFGTILGVALLGIGLGGLAYNWVFLRWFRPTLAALAATFALEALAIVFPFALGDRLAVLAAWYNQTAGSFADLAIGWLAITSIVVLPAALVSGLQFPLLIALLGEGRGEIGRHVGVAYAWNTAGAISGSLVAGFGALPILSAPGMWIGVGGLVAVVALLLAALSQGAWRTHATVGLVLAATAYLATFRGPTAGWRHSGIGAGRADFASFAPNTVDFVLRENRRALAWEADGLEASIGIRDFDGYEFVVNGKVDGNSLSDAPTQVGVALLGAVHHEDPKTGMVIGLGTGESAGWLAEMRGVERVDAVELEPAIDKMVELCGPVNFDALRHPEVRRVYNDGRETMLTTDQKYDVIISEPSNPYRAGVATLYTTEFYQAASRRLNEGGVFVQFLQAYEVDNQTVATVLATVRSAFDHVEVWQTLPVDLQLVCSNEPLRYTADDLRERVDSPVVKRAVERVWMTPGVEGFLSHFAANAGWVDHVAGLPNVEINTDDRTILEYRFAKTVGQPTGFSVDGARAMLAQEGWHRPTIDDNAVDWRRVELMRQLSNLINRGPLSAAMLTQPEDQALLRALEMVRVGDYGAALAAWPEAYAEPEIPVLRLVLSHCMAEQAKQECLDLVAPLAESHPADVHAVRTICHWYGGQPEEAKASLQALVATLRDTPWGIDVLMQSALDRSIDIAKQDRESAEQVYRLLEQPMVANRFEYMRRIARVLIARDTADPEWISDAFAPLEPNVPWRLDLLETRAEAYRAAGRPLADKAAAEVERFKSQARQGS